MADVPLITEAPLHYDPAWAYTFHILLRHSTESRVLMLRGESGWFLPYFLSREHDLRGVRHIQSMVRRQLGVEGSVLRCLYVDCAHVGDNRVDAIFEMEDRTSNWRPPDGARWVSRRELANLPPALPEQRSVIDD